QRIRSIYSAQRPKARSDHPAASLHVGPPLLVLHGQGSIGLISDNARRCLFGAELRNSNPSPPAKSQTNSHPNSEVPVGSRGCPLFGSRGDREDQAQRPDKHPVIGLICSLTLGTLLRPSVVLSVSARPRPMSHGFDLP